MSGTAAKYPKLWRNGRNPPYQMGNASSDFRNVEYRIYSEKAQSVAEIPLFAYNVKLCPRTR